MEMLLIARVKEKAASGRGRKFDVYRVQGDHGAEYAVWVNPVTGYACKCTCQYKVHHPSKRCKHMRKMDEQRREAPLYRRQPFSMMK